MEGGGWEEKEGGREEGWNDGGGGWEEGLDGGGGGREEDSDSKRRRVDRRECLRRKSLISDLDSDSMVGGEEVDMLNL